MEAQTYLGVCYFYGEGVEKDIDKAIELLREASKQGEENAQYYLGICYYNGEGVEKDVEKYIELIESAANQGNSDAITELGIIYKEGKIKSKNTYMAIELFKQAANKGNPDAQVYLGICYFYGEGVEQDFSKAFKLFKEASKKQNGYAEMNLGICYKDGYGIKKDINRAIELFEKSINRGIIQAQVYLGVCYYEGEGIARDINKAMELFEKSANEGYRVGYTYLGICYYEGKGIKKDINKAIKFFEKASEQGEKNAKMNLALCFERNQIKDKDIYEIKKIYSDLLQEDDPRIKEYLEKILSGYIDNEKNYIRYIMQLEKSTSDMQRLYNEQDGIMTNLENNQLLREIKKDTTKLNNKVDNIIDIMEKNILAHIKEQKQKFNLTYNSKQRICEFISDNVAYINQKIKELNTSTVKEEKILKSLFGEKWGKLSNESKKSLISGEVIWNTIFNKENFDFSAICICLSSALEVELSKYFFEDYKKYLKSKFGNPNFDSWPQSMLSTTEKQFNDKMDKYNNGTCKRPYIGQKNRFTLGALPYIFCLKFNSDISDERKNKEKTILNEYIKTILKDKYKKDSEIIFIKPYLDNNASFVEKCENIRKNYRNKAAHKGCINKNEAQCCYNEIIGDKEDENSIVGILLQLFEVLK